MFCLYFLLTLLSALNVTQTTDINKNFLATDLNTIIKIGDYDIDGVLGVGSQGIAYKASKDNKSYAIKLISPLDFKTDVYNTLISKKPSKSISIEEIINVNFKDQLLKGIVMEYLEGQDLYTYSNSDDFKKLSKDEKLTAAYQYLNCVKNALSQLQNEDINIKHNDLLQTNIYLVNNDIESCKIIDFDKAIINVNRHDKFQNDIDDTAAVKNFFQLIGKNINITNKITSDVLGANNDQEVYLLLKALKKQYKKKLRGVY